jgi:hypothetical protein
MASPREGSWRVAPPVERVDATALESYLANLGEDAARARHLVAAIDAAVPSIASLSSLSAPLAVDYLQRLARPVPSLSLPAGVEIVTRAYLAHLVTEMDPGAVGARDVPVLGTLPPLRRGRPPQDLLSRVVKASRRNFELIRAVSTPVWNGLVQDLTRRAHDLVPGEATGPPGLLAPAVVDGLARFGWVLRQVDLHYGLAPEYR